MRLGDHILRPDCLHQASDRRIRLQPIRGQSFRANQLSTKPENPHFALTKRDRSESGTAPQQMKVGSIEHLLDYFHLSVFTDCRFTFHHIIAYNTKIIALTGHHQGSLTRAPNLKWKSCPSCQKFLQRSLGSAK
jgi:hypothetical protein